LPEPLRTTFASVEALLPDAANYPDIFDNPTRPDAVKASVDADWRRFCVFPDNLAGRCLHTWPHPNTEQAMWRPVTEHWVSQAMASWRGGDLPGFVKFIGCLSHFFGDMTQSAHLVDLKLLAELLPAPASMAGFHYHTDLEAVTGACGPLRPPQLLGLSVPEVAWRVAAATTQAMRDCRRYIVPILQTLFAGDQAEAERHAGPPITAAAQITADVAYSTWRLATGEVPSEEREALRSVDLRCWKPDAARHDSVYGDAILDGNRSTPPSGAPIVPARLRCADGSIRPVKGLGVLPHSGMCGPRECWMRFGMPAGVFARFEAQVGLHADLTTDGAADFVVELDGREAFRSGRRSALDPALPLCVPLGASTTISLKVEDANDGRTFWNNHAFWAEPRLIKG
jgi:hypothetical protein